MVMSSSQAPSPGMREEAKQFKTAACSFSSQPRKLCWAARCKAPLARGWEAAQLPSKSDTLESDRLVAPVSFFRVKVNSAMAFALSMKPGVCGCVCLCVCVCPTYPPPSPTHARRNVWNDLHINKLSNMSEKCFNVRCSMSEKCSMIQWGASNFFF